MANVEPAASHESIHRSILLDSTAKFKSSKTYTDITIIVDGKSFEAHRQILASYSDYFHAMFTDGMLESMQNVIHISGITSSGLTAILNYMYTSKLQIIEDNVQDILATALYTQVSPVMEACIQFLKNKINVANCIDIITIAENFSLAELRIDVLDFVVSTFKNFVIFSEFHRLTPGQIEYVVSRDIQMNITEFEFLRHILLWFLDENAIESTLKLQHAEAILKHIRFSDITPSQLQTMIDSLFAEKQLCKTGHILYETIMKISSSSQNMLRAPLTFNTRGTKLTVLQCGRLYYRITTNGNESEMDMISQFNYKDNTDEPTSHLMWIPVLTKNICTTVVNNELYIISPHKNVTNRKFNSRTNKWLTIHWMHWDRIAYTLNTLNNKLYVVGGYVVPDDVGHEGHDYICRKVLNSAEYYDVDTGRWSLIASFPETIYYHAAVSCTHSECDMLYVSGGCREFDGPVVASMYVYSVEKDTWKSCAPLLTPRCCHYMFYYNHKIYVCGGRNLDRKLHSIDVYDVLTNTWSFLTNAPNNGKYTRYGVVLHESKLRFVGQHRDLVKRKYLVDVYDILEDTWTRTIKKFKDHMKRCTFVTLYIPKF